MIARNIIRHSIPHQIHALCRRAYNAIVRVLNISGADFGVAVFVLKVHNIAPFYCVCSLVGYPDTPRGGTAVVSI